MTASTDYQRSFVALSRSKVKHDDDPMVTLYTTDVERFKSMAQHYHHKKTTFGFDEERSFASLVAREKKRIDERGARWSLEGEGKGAPVRPIGFAGSNQAKEEFKRELSPAEASWKGHGQVCGQVCELSVTLGEKVTYKNFGRVDLPNAVTIHAYGSEAGTSYSLEKPKKGQDHRASITIEPHRVLDPKGLIRGSDPHKSQADEAKIDKEVQNWKKLHSGKSRSGRRPAGERLSPEDLKKGAADLRLAAMERMGYQAEATQAPGAMHRDLKVYDQAVVTSQRPLKDKEKVEVYPYHEKGDAAARIDRDKYAKYIGGRKITAIRVLKGEHRLDRMQPDVEKIDTVKNVLARFHGELQPETEHLLKKAGFSFNRQADVWEGSLLDGRGRQLFGDSHPIFDGSYRDSVNERWSGLLGALPALDKEKQRERVQEAPSVAAKEKPAKDQEQEPRKEQDLAGSGVAAVGKGEEAAAQRHDAAAEIRAERTADHQASTPGKEQPQERVQEPARVAAAADKEQTGKAQEPRKEQDPARSDLVAAGQGEALAEPHHDAAAVRAERNEFADRTAGHQFLVAEKRAAFEAAYVSPWPKRPKHGEPSLEEKVAALDALPADERTAAHQEKLSANRAAYAEARENRRRPDHGDFLEAPIGEGGNPRRPVFMNDAEKNYEYQAKTALIGARQGKDIKVSWADGSIATTSSYTSMLGKKEFSTHWRTGENKGTRVETKSRRIGNHFRRQIVTTRADGTRIEAKESGANESWLWGSKSRIERITEGYGAGSTKESETRHIGSRYWGKTITHLPDGTHQVITWRGHIERSIWGDSKMVLHKDHCHTETTIDHTYSAGGPNLLRALSSRFVGAQGGQELRSERDSSRVVRAISSRIVGAMERQEHIDHRALQHELARERQQLQRELPAQHAAEVDRADGLKAPTFAGVFRKIGDWVAGHSKSAPDIAHDVSKLNEQGREQIPADKLQEKVPAERLKRDGERHEQRPEAKEHRRDRDQVRDEFRPQPSRDDDHNRAKTAGRSPDRGIDR